MPKEILEVYLSKQCYRTRVDGSFGSDRQVTFVSGARVAVGVDLQRAAEPRAAPEASLGVYEVY